MKKLYVLVFLVMIIGNNFIYASEQVYNNSRPVKNGKYTMEYYTNIDSRGESGSHDTKNIILTITDIPKGIDALTLNGIKRQIAVLEDFVRSATGLKEYEIITINFSDNPWDTLAPRIFAEKFELKQSALTKSFGGLGNWIREAILRGAPLTPEKRFMIRLQKALIEKISSMTDAEKIMEPLKALLLANSKAGFGEKSITDIFGSITNANTKKAVMLEIMKQLKSVTIEKNGTIKDGNRKNTLAELVLESITDVNMRRALVAVAKKLEENKLKGIKYSNEEAFLKQMINDPSKKYEATLNTEINMRGSTRIGNEYHDADFSQKLNELIPEFISSPTQTEI